MGWNPVKWKSWTTGSQLEHNDGTETFIQESPRNRKSHEGFQLPVLLHWHFRSPTHHFATIWSFCHFLMQRTRWCFPLGGRRNTTPHLKKTRELLQFASWNADNENVVHQRRQKRELAANITNQVIRQKQCKFGDWEGVLPQIFVHDSTRPRRQNQSTILQASQTYLCVLGVSVQFLSFANSICRSCYPQIPTQSTETDSVPNYMSQLGTQTREAEETATAHHFEENYGTFPPVTEKFAKMQYFSFLWPVYVFRHWNEKVAESTAEALLPQNNHCDMLDKWIRSILRTLQYIGV